MTQKLQSNNAISGPRIPRKPVLDMQKLIKHKYEYMRQLSLPLLCNQTRQKYWSLDSQWIRESSSILKYIQWIYTWESSSILKYIYNGLHGNPSEYFNGFNTGFLKMFRIQQNPLLDCQWILVEYIMYIVVFWWILEVSRTKYWRILYGFSVFGTVWPHSK